MMFFHSPVLTIAEVCMETFATSSLLPNDYSEDIPFCCESFRIDM
jgi:hypothetical protein